MMGCFLADRTTTLHDLANNGLLQLDQIRSYNPLSIFSNQSSNDNDDKEKEAEENFLDEIDTSSRRTSSKVNEQNSLSKRLTDTSITTKQTKISRISSDENPRKSSLSSETSSDSKEKRIAASKQQRRQTVPVNPVSSRLSNQTTGKKTSKCKEKKQCANYYSHTFDFILGNQSKLIIRIV